MTNNMSIELMVINTLVAHTLYYNSLRRHCGGFDVFLAGINEKLAAINNVYAL